MNAPEVSIETVQRWQRIQLEGLAQEPCTCENNGDYCESCIAREEKSQQIEKLLEGK
jgi:hypothetical protein